ncbi:hypothetical protein F0562_016211 [Nyssa sinensis]|uniref:DUF309 domain-containing protein n=1 Tax=Nyssa sinensis TaxID=561372 RepID=A0A5J4ZK98_9ASTE|nr:hypothetical protein F0562_016211 [Nyssa sinensis]
MAILSISLVKHPHLYPLTSPRPPPSSSTSTIPLTNSPNFSYHSSPTPKVHHPHLLPNHTPTTSDSFRASYRFSSSRTSMEEDDDEDEHNAVNYGSFEEAVALFNGRDYYKCHDFLEALWNKSQDPVRTLIHGILQCAVGFHHLFNQNHKGAMMELGEGLCKLRKMNFECGPFHQFEQEISALLDFIYHTQLELAACTDDFCLSLDQSERSYQLLGGYAAGQHLYHLESDSDDIVYIVFCPERSYATGEPPRVKLPVLHASEEHLMAFEYD